MTTRQWIPAGGLVATIAMAVYVVVQLSAQAPPTTGDFTKATMAQVRDGQGWIVLEGPFMAPVEADGNLERRATLMSTGVVGNAAGEAEVEFAKTAATTQEVEFDVRNLPPGTSVTFVIDGTDIASATTDRHGHAEAERDLRISGARASR